MIALAVSFQQSAVSSERRRAASSFVARQAES
jgi:hypothetical protein